MSILSNSKKNANDATCATKDAAKTDIKDIANKAGKELRHFAEEAGDRISTTSGKVAKHVRENPVRTGAIALALGVAARLLFRRRG